MPSNFRKKLPVNPSSAQQPQFIPNKIHFIWVGTPLPPKYAENILNWTEKNPLYSVCLWTEFTSIPSNLKMLMDIFNERIRDPLHQDIEVVDTHEGKMLSVQSIATRPFELLVNPIEILHPISDPGMMQEELTVWKNYGTVSDTLRIWILHQEGGIYMDTDTYFEGGSLPLEITVPHGVLLGETPFFATSAVCNAVMAAHPNTDIIANMARALEETYAEHYSLVTAGVRTVSPVERERLEAVERDRRLTAEGTKMASHRRMLIWDSFIEPALERGRSFNKALDIPPVHEEFVQKYSFQRHTGFKLIVKSEASWQR